MKNWKKCGKLENPEKTPENTNISCKTFGLAHLFFFSFFDQLFNCKLISLPGNCIEFGTSGLPGGLEFTQVYANAPSVIYEGGKNNDGEKNVILHDLCKAHLHIIVRTESTDGTQRPPVTALWLANNVSYQFFIS